MENVEGTDNLNDEETNGPNDNQKIEKDTSQISKEEMEKLSGAETVSEKITEEQEEIEENRPEDDKPPAEPEEEKLLPEEMTTEEPEESITEEVGGEIVKEEETIVDDIAFQSPGEQISTGPEESIETTGESSIEPPVEATEISEEMPTIEENPPGEDQPLAEAEEPKVVEVEDTLERITSAPTIEATLDEVLPDKLDTEEEVAFIDLDKDVEEVVEWGKPQAIGEVKSFTAGNQGLNVDFDNVEEKKPKSKNIIKWVVIAIIAILIIFWIYLFVSNTFF